MGGEKGGADYWCVIRTQPCIVGLGGYFPFIKENHGPKFCQSGDLAELEEFTSCKQEKGESFRTYQDVSHSERIF